MWDMSSVTNHHGVSLVVVKSGHMMLFLSKRLTRSYCHNFQRGLIYIQRFIAHIFTTKSLWDNIGTSTNNLKPDITLGIVYI